MPAEERSPHHLVPRMFRGRETVTLHRICHRKIHSLWTERELKNHFHTIERIREHPDVRQFVAWLRSKPPDFYQRTSESRRKRRRR